MSVFGFTIVAEENEALLFGLLCNYQFNEFVLDVFRTTPSSTNYSNFVERVFETDRPLSVEPQWRLISFKHLHIWVFVDAPHAEQLTVDRNLISSITTLQTVRKEGQRSRCHKGLFWFVIIWILFSQ